MRLLLIILMLSTTSCLYTYTEIPQVILNNARCECRNNGGVGYIKIRAAKIPMLKTTADSLYNFVCKDGLETGWWLYRGSMGMPGGGFSPWYDENCNDNISGHGSMDIKFR